MSSGAPRVFRGSFIGTGASLDIRVVGFRPGKLTIFNTAGEVKAEWINEMPDASMMIDDGAGVDFVSVDGITPLSDGFTVGANADLNVDGELCVYEASE